MSTYTKIISFDNYTWIRVFYHNIKGDIFNSMQEGEFYISKYRYSILRLMDDSAKIDNQFEFILDYPGHQGYNRWKQDKNPLDDFEADNDNRSTAYGYTPIEISWDKSNQDALHFGGLVRSSTDKTLIDGYVNNDSEGTLLRWFYAIGSVEKYYNGIPGYINGIGFNEVELWLRVNNVFFYNDRQSYQKKYHYMICRYCILPLIDCGRVNYSC